MLGSNIPAKFFEFWAKNTPGANIRTIPLTTATPGNASLDQGFPPINATPVGAGGIPPFIQDANGILQQITAWTQWMTAGGGLVAWDSAFSTAIGGYPNGAIVLSATTFGAYYVSTADNNTTNPDAGGAGWQPGSLFGSATTGDVKMSYKTTADFGWIGMNDGSIGDATSGATTRANADTQPLFSLMYINMVDANAPIQTSGGGATTRAAQGSAATAYANHCRLVLPAMLGRALASAGAGAGLTARSLGQQFGEELHVLVVGELAIHAHAFAGDPLPAVQFTKSGTTTNQVAAGGGPVAFVTGGGNAITTDPQSPGTPTGTIGAAGSNNGHNTMQPTSFLNPYCKL
jgi:microcystin-dependent protein